MYICLCNDSQFIVRTVFAKTFVQVCRRSEGNLKECWLYCGLTPLLLFPKRAILNSSILKEFADDNFEFDENGGKLSRMVENTVGKGEIARYEKFLLFPQHFQKICIADTWKLGLVWERVNS